MIEHKTWLNHQSYRPAANEHRWIVRPIVYCWKKGGGGIDDIEFVALNIRLKEATTKRSLWKFVNKKENPETKSKGNKAMEYNLNLKNRWK